MNRRPDPRKRRARAFAAFVIGVVLVSPAGAQAPPGDSLASWVRRGYVLSSPESREVWQELGWSGVGFGFRTFQARGGSNAGLGQSIEQFGASMEYYRIKLDTLFTKIDGDIGLAWGVHTEVFQVKGQLPESIRVRFTNTLRWDGRTWKNLLYHRDAQPFTANGFYIRNPR
jgi:hypothetical protein